MRERLRCADGRCRRTSRRASGPRAHFCFDRRWSRRGPCESRTRRRRRAGRSCAARSWALPGTAMPRRLGGDVAIIRGPDPYTVADDPATAPQVVIQPGQRCMTPDGVEVGRAHDTWVYARGATARAARRSCSTGTYPLRRRGQPATAESAARRAGRARRQVGLPRSSRARRRDRQGRAGTGGGARPVARPAAHRRASGWFARPEAGRPAGTAPTPIPWSDGRCGLLHNKPAHPWTVAALARETGVARDPGAAVQRARRRTADGFLTSGASPWPATCCASRAPVGSVARQVGYGSPFALSTAFKRPRRQPEQHRARAAA